jgi:hypothetical protein
MRRGLQIGAEALTGGEHSAAQPDRAHEQGQQAPGAAYQPAVTGSPAARRPQDLLALQRSVGNQSVQRLLSGQAGAQARHTPQPAQIQRQLHVAGPRKKELLEILNHILGPHYGASLGSGDMLQIRAINTQGVPPGTAEFFKILNTVIADQHTVSIQFVANAATITIGNWDPAAIDVADVLEFQTAEQEMGPDMRSILAHEIQEQYYRQVRHINDYKTAHVEGGIAAEDRVTGARRIDSRKVNALKNADQTNSLQEIIQFQYPSGKTVEVTITIDHNKVVSVARRVVASQTSTAAKTSDVEAEESLSAWLANIGNKQPKQQTKAIDMFASDSDQEEDIFSDTKHTQPTPTLDMFSGDENEGVHMPVSNEEDRSGGGWTKKPSHTGTRPSSMAVEDFGLPQTTPRGKTFQKQQFSSTASPISSTGLEAHQNSALMPPSFGNQIPSPTMDSPLAPYTQGVFTPEALAQHFPAIAVSAILSSQPGPFQDKYGGRWLLIAQALPQQVSLKRVG